MLVQGLLRCSTETQVQADTLDAQAAQIQGWCAFKGLPAPALEREEAVSGTLGADARPGLRRALRSVLRAAEAGEVAVFVASAFDRLGRDLVEQVETAAVLEDAGVRLVTLQDGIDTANPAGKSYVRQQIQMRALFGEWERPTIVARLQNGRQRARARSRVYASEPPFGQREAVTVERGHEVRVLVDDLREQAVIARVKELRATGVSLPAIARTLDAEGFRPRRGSAWSLSLLHRIVTGKRAPVKKKQSPRVARARAVIFADDQEVA
jgi:DNA invertase Pin-like site-specific DNA recombinase